MKDYSKYILNIKKSPIDRRDFKFRNVYAAVDLPLKTNNRQHMLPARDQGNQGTCAAFSASEAQQCRDTKEFGLNEYLSPQFIYNHREQPQEEGMYNRDLMKLMQDKGVCLEKLYKYGTFTTPTPEAYENALNHRSNNYAQIDYLGELKQALYIKGPCIIAIPVYNYTERMWYQRDEDYFLGGHDMCVVDYDDERRVLTILNSWGDDFGWIWELWSNVDLPSSPTTTEAPTTTTVPEPNPNTWINKYWWILVLAVLAVGVVVALIPYIF